jgi:hypothetical protein
MDRIQELASEIQQLREQYQLEVATSNRTWPKSIRERALELQRLELSNGKISQLTGIPVPTLYVWSRPEKVKQYARRKKGSFMPVKVQENKKSLTVDLEKRATELTLLLPGGIRIIGASPGVIIELIRGLSR